MFREDASGRFLEKWPTYFKPRILANSKNSNEFVEDLLSGNQCSDGSGKHGSLSLWKHLITYLNDTNIVCCIIWSYLRLFSDVNLSDNLLLSSAFPLGWDSDLSSILLLIHLLPPTAKGHKKGPRISSYQAAQHLVRYLTVSNIYCKFFCATCAWAAYVFSSVVGH